jgi:hypothetical protein
LHHSGKRLEKQNHISTTTILKLFTCQKAVAYIPLITTNTTTSYFLCEKRAGTPVAYKCIMPNFGLQQHEFNVITIPANPPISNQSFKPVE